VSNGVFLSIMDKTAEGGLKSIRNTMTVRKNPQENREQLEKFPLNLKFLYATGARLLYFVLGHPLHIFFLHVSHFVSLPGLLKNGKNVTFPS